MSERDELADLVYKGSYSDPDSPRIQPLMERGRSEIARTFSTADRILAAGYRKQEP